MLEKVVLVTGADGGLGTFVTQAFLERGATVMGASPGDPAVCLQRCSFHRPGRRPFSRETAQMLVDQALTHFGRLDVLVHTVGGFTGGASIADTDDATFQRMMNINLNSVFHIVRAALPVLRRAADGRIIAIAAAPRSTQGLA